nr:hypothetical protein [uncultured Celeribacter sp.]
MKHLKLIVAAASCAFAAFPAIAETVPGATVDCTIQANAENPQCQLAQQDAANDMNFEGDVNNVVVVGGALAAAAALAAIAGGGSDSTPSTPSTN